MISAYVGSGLQLFMAGALFAWLPSYLNRAYHLRPDKAGIAAAGFILLMGIGMIVCGVITDRLTKHVAIRKWTAALVFTAISFVALTIGFTQQPGALQLLLIAVGAFFTGGTTGPAGAMVANLTPASIRATAFGTLTLANNLLGLAAGPLVVGAIADRVGLVDAMKVAPLVSVIAMVALLIGRRAYPSSLRRVGSVDSVGTSTAAPSPPSAPSAPTDHTPEITSTERSPGMMLRETHHALVIVPGLRGHVEDHWQTRLAAKLPDAVVVPSFGRDKRDLAGRVADLHRVIQDAATPVTIVAHSAGVLTTLHWARQHDLPVRGALLATPPDLARPLPPEYPTLSELEESGWLPVPVAPLRFPSIVAASTNDALGDFENVRSLARRGAAGSSTSDPWDT